MSNEHKPRLRPGGPGCSRRPQQAQRSNVDGWGLSRWKSRKSADTERLPVYADARAGKIAVAESTTRAQEAVTRLTSF